MFRTKQAHTDTIFFSRWSRKSYAIFASLKKIVRISPLSIDICQSSLLKIPSIIHLRNLLGISEIEDDVIDINEQLENLMLSLASMPIIINNNDTYSQSRLIIYNTESPYFAYSKIWAFSF